MDFGYAPQPVWVFIGRVYDGVPGDTSRPLDGVTVRLRGSNTPDDPGVLLASAPTSTGGAYGFWYRGAGYPHFHLIEEDLAGWFSTGAMAGSGSDVVDFNHIRISQPQADHYYVGNNFFDMSLTPTPTATLTPVITVTLTPTATLPPVITVTLTPTPTLTWTPSPTWMPTPTPTATLTPTPTRQRCGPGTPCPPLYYVPLVLGYERLK